MEGGGGGGWKEKTTKGRQTVASVPSPLSLVSIITVSQQMVGRMGMKGGKKKGEKAPCCHPFRFSLPHSTKGETPVTLYSGKLRSKVHFFPAMSSTRFNRCQVVLLGQTSSRFYLCCFVIYVSLCPPLKKVCKTSRQL